MYTVIISGDRTSDQRLHSRNSTTEQLSISHSSDAKLAIHGNCAANKPESVLQITFVLLQKTQSPPGLRLPKRTRNTHQHNYYDPKGKDTDVHFSFFFYVEEFYCELNNHDQKKKDKCNPESVLENERHRLLWDFEIQTNHLISARRPDLIIINKKENLQDCGLCCPGGPQIKIERIQKEG